MVNSTSRIQSPHIYFTFPQTDLFVGFLAVLCEGPCLARRSVDAAGVAFTV
jgi:hypothetical protein